MNSLPAILIGGPPHAGKSVLFYSLTHALRERHIPHHAIRACLDGEGELVTRKPSQHCEPEFVFVSRRHGPLALSSVSLRASTSLSALSYRYGRSTA